MSKILNSTIGIAGCGTMGLPMLEVLLKNNINAFGYDIISKESFSSLKKNFISSKKDFFQKVDVIFSVVRDINQTKELCEGKNGLFQLNSPKTLIMLLLQLLPACLRLFFYNNCLLEPELQLAFPPQLKLKDHVSFLLQDSPQHVHKIILLI